MTYLPSWASLKIYQPNGDLYQDYTADDGLELEFGDVINGGYSDCRFKLCDYYERIGDYGYIVEIKDEDEDFVLFRGLMQQPTFDVGNFATIVALGHGHPEGSSSFKRDWGTGNQTPPNGKQIWPIGTPIEDIFSDSLSMCQQIFQAEWVDLSAIQLVQESRDYNGMSPYELWQDLSSWFTSLATPLIWYVRDSAGLNGLYLSYADSATRYRCTWDNDTVKVTYSYNIKSTHNLAAVRYGNGLRQTSPSNEIRSHAVLPTNTDIDKYINEDNRIRGDADAQALADLYMTRFGNMYRPENGTIILCGASVTALPPVVDEGEYPTGRLNYPIHMIQAGWTIETLDIPVEQAPFDATNHWITAVRYNFDKNQMTLTTGELVNLASTLNRLSERANSLGAIAAQQASYSTGEYRPQATPIYGPQALGTSPDLADSDTYDHQIGQTVYALTEQADDEDNQFYAPFKAVVAPQTIADYGVQANFGREADSVGIKGFIRVIPCKVLTWEIAFLPPASSDTIPTQSIQIEFYSTYPFTAGSPFATKTVTNAQSASGTFTGLQQQTFAQGGKIGIRVSNIGLTGLGTGDPVAGSGFIVAVGGRKLFPDVGVTS